MSSVNARSAGLGELNNGERGKFQSKPVISRVIRYGSFERMGVGNWLRIGRDIRGVRSQGQPVPSERRIGADDRPADSGSIHGGYETGCGECALGHHRSDGWRCWSGVPNEQRNRLDKSGVDMKKTDAESDVKIFRVRSEDAFNLPEFRNLIEEAFSGGIPVDSETAVLELSRLIEHPSLNIIVAKEDGKMKGLSIAMLPSCLLF